MLSRWTVVALAALSLAEAGHAAQGTQLSPAFLAHLRSTKAAASSFMRTVQFTTSRGVAALRTAGGRLFPIMEDDEGTAATAAVPLRHASIAASTSGLPPFVDHRPTLSRIKDQKYRGTCTAHATLAALEAFPEVPDDLSEQDAHWVFMKAERRRLTGGLIELPGPRVRDNEGVDVDRAADYLRDWPVCEATVWPYVESLGGLSARDEARPAAASRHARYGIEKATKLDGRALRDPETVARILARGYNVVVAVTTAWDEAAVNRQNGLLDVVLVGGLRPHPGRGRHAMLICGYDLGRKVFIVRNSFGVEWGDRGYCYMTADYLRTYARCGFYVEKVKVVAPAPASDSLARRGAERTTRSVGGPLGASLSLLGL